MSEHTRVIGRGNVLPWNVPEDYEQFLRFVRGQAVVMGRTSYEVFGADLSECDLFVVTRRDDVKLFPRTNTKYRTRIVSSIDEALTEARATGRTVYCGGGGSIYGQMMPQASDMYLSLIHGEHEGDTYFPEWHADEWHEVLRREHAEFTFVHLRRSD